MKATKRTVKINQGGVSYRKYKGSAPKIKKVANMIKSSKC